MEVSVEVTENLQRRMTVAIPAEEIEKEVAKRLADVRKKARINGFRPGKVPLSVVKSQYGDQVRQEVVGEVVNSSYSAAITEQGLRPAGGPNIEPVTLPPNQPLEYVATFEIYPEIDLCDPAQLAVTRTGAEIADGDVDSVIQKLREQRTQWNLVDRPAVKGDKVTMDFKGALADGSDFPGNSAVDSEITLGEGRLVGGFEDQIEGASAGETRGVDITFPDDYGSKELAGQSATFTVEVKAITEPSLPAIDAEFIKAYGVEDGSEASFRTQVRERLEKERDDAAKKRVKGSVMEALRAANSVEIPTALLASEVEGLRRRMLENIQGAGSNALGTLPDEIFKEEAERRVALGLLLSTIVKKHELKADGDAVRAYIEEAAADYEHPTEVVNWYYADETRLTEVEMVVVEDQVVEWVLANGQVTDETVSFDELVGKTDSSKGGQS